MAFGQEVGVSAAVPAELGRQLVRVLRDGLPPDLQVGEVAVFQQVDRVEQCAPGVEAEHRHDLPGREAEQPQPGPGHRGRVPPAMEGQRADIQGFTA